MSVSVTLIWVKLLYLSRILSVTVAVLVECKQWDYQCELWVRFLLRTSFSFFLKVCKKIVLKLILTNPRNIYCML